jgi:hypothetical protein
MVGGMQTYIGSRVVKESKYGSFVRGMVREDGKVFWAYDHGKESWCSPNMFLKRKAREAELHEQMRERQGRGRAAERTKLWREQNPEKWKKLKAETDAAAKSRSRLRKAMRAYGKVVEALRAGRTVACCGERYLKVPITQKEAAVLAEVMGDLVPRIGGG